VPLASLRTAIAAVCLLALTACTGGGASSATGGMVSFAPADRKDAPDLRGTTILDKTQFSLAAQRGHVVVVNYWASWCDPCREELPALHDVYEDFSGKGVQFIGVDYRGDGRTTSAAEAFLKGHQVPYDSLFDPDSKTVLQFRGKVTIAAPPVTLVIDKQGRIAALFEGVVVYTQLRDKIAAEQAAA
jgi:thiol-disulfide isomerase/thioredoxin